MKYLYAVLFITLIACGKKDCTTLLTEYINNPSPVTDEIKTVVDEVNAYRSMQGQLPLTEGLTCSTYINLSNALTAFPTSLPSAAMSFKYVGVFNQPNTSVNSGLNILPEAVRNQSTYKQWYAVRCSGYIAITKAGYYSFETYSDDASLLYINGTKVVDNDGNHGAQLRSGSILLNRGVYSFRLDYMQGPAGNQALILTSSNTLVSSNVFFR